MENNLLKGIVRNALLTGSALTATTTAAILVASVNDNTGCWGAINSVSHIVDGDEVVYGDDFSLRDSLIGVGINATAMYTWASIYAVIFGNFRFPKSLVTASAMTAAAYATDYYLVPKQYTPGIEKKLSKKAIFAIYSVMAITLALSPLFNNKQRR